MHDDGRKYVHKHTTGSALHFTIKIRDLTAANALVDPDTIIVRTLDPDGDVHDVTPGHVATGVYSYTAVMSKDGKWKWEVLTTGEVQAVEIIEGFAVPGLVPTVPDPAVADPTGPYRQLIKTVPGTAYTVELADVAKLICYTASVGTVLVVLPPDDEVDIRPGERVDHVQLGAAPVVFDDDGAVTIRTPASSTIRVENSVVSTFKLAANVWLLIGDFAPA